MQFQNFSSTEFTRSLSGSSIDAVLQNLNKRPSGHLKAHSGLEELSADQNALSFIATGDIDLYCTWYDATSGERLGIKIHVPVQVLGIGTGPYWYYAWDQGKGINDAYQWHQIGDPADVKEFDMQHFKVQARPEAHHDSLKVLVTIQDKK